MSVLAGLYNVDFTVKRAGVTSDTASSTYTTIATYRGLIRSAGRQGVVSETRFFDGGREGRENKLWCGTATDILANDIIIVNGITYTVSAVNTMQDLEGNETHKELRIFR